jgi:hypothetical protein
MKLDARAFANVSALLVARIAGVPAYPLPVNLMILGYRVGARRVVSRWGSVWSSRRLVR